MTNQELSRTIDARADYAVRKGVDPGQVDVGEIRAVLRADGVMLEPSPEAREMTFPGA